MKRKKPAFIIASIRIDRDEWDRFAGMVLNRSKSIREYIKGVLDGEERKSIKRGNRKL